MAVQAQYPSNVLLSDWRNRMRQMIGGDNRNLFSSVPQESISTLEDLQLQNSNSAIPNQLLLFNAYPGLSHEQQQVQNAYVLNEAEIELARNLQGPRKRPREGYELIPARRHRSSSVPGTDVNPNQGSVCVTLPQATGGDISTGLCLAFNEESSKSSVISSNGLAGNPTILSVLNGHLTSELHHQREEIDQYIRFQGEQVKEALEEKRRRHFRALLTVIEEGVSRKFREKEAEAEKLTRRNLQLEERLKQLSIEAHVWQSKAKCNEALVCALKTNLQQAEAQSRELISREGCGDSEADDAASSHYGENGDVHARILHENKELKEQRSCRVCRSNDVCMLLLPCRHLCLCKNCEGRLDACPLCRSLKSASVQVYMS